MKISVWLGLQFLLFGAWASSSASTLSLADNQIAVHVGAIRNNQPNVPTVTVTVCQPGTTQCQTIDKILLDTGSVGLHLFSPLPGLQLPRVSDGTGKDIFECVQFYGDADGSGGDNYWGGVQYADVYLGKEVAKKLHVQTLDENIPTNTNCLRTSKTPRSVNGILGVNINHDDCSANFNSDSQCDKGSSFYYSCDGNRCEGPIANAGAFSLQNPIQALNQDNSGYIIEFPAVQKAQMQIDGILTFGINSQDNNQLGKTGERKIAFNKYGWLWTSIDGKISHVSQVDTGTGFYFVPPSLNLAACSGGFQGVLCPKNSTPIAGHFLDDNGHVERAFSFQVDDPSYIEVNGMESIPNLGVTGPEKLLLLGLPFFYGKKIFFGFPQNGDSTNPNGYIAY